MMTGSSVLERTMRGIRAMFVTICGIVLLPVACDGDPAGLDIDEDSLKPIPEIADLDYATVSPAVGWDYWELRYTLQGSQDPAEVLGSGGTLEKSELEPAVAAAVDAATSIHGFATGCLPAHCYEYIVAADGAVVTVFATAADLRTFLGDLETLAEATLMVHGMGFTWSRSEPATGYREADSSGWDFVVLELVKACAPVQTDRVLLRVEPSLPVIELDREVWHSDERVCI